MKKGLHPGDLFVCYCFISNNALLADLHLKCGIIKPKIKGVVRNHLNIFYSDAKIAKIFTKGRKIGGVSDFFKSILNYSSQFNLLRMILKVLSSVTLRTFREVQGQRLPRYQGALSHFPPWLCCG